VALRTVNDCVQEEGASRLSPSSTSRVIVCVVVLTRAVETLTCGMLKMAVAVWKCFATSLQQLLWMLDAGFVHGSLTFAKRL